MSWWYSEGTSSQTLAKVISKSVYRCNDVKSATRSSRLAIGLSMDDWVGAVCTVLNIVLKAGAGEIDTSVLNILDISNQSKPEKILFHSAFLENHCIIRRKGK